MQATGSSGHVHVWQGTSDDAGVIAEEEGAQRRDGSNCAQGALLAEAGVFSTSSRTLSGV